MLQQAGVAETVLPAVVVPEWDRDGLGGVRGVGLGWRVGPGREEVLEAAWGEAVEAWLGSKEARTGSKHTRRAYEGAVRLFFEGCERKAWEVGGVEVIRWQQGMRAAGLSEATINLRLAALSSLFEFACYKFVMTDARTGREVPLAERNPVRRVDRAAVSPYEKSSYLGVDEVRALLRACDRSTVVGLRDYALIVSYIYTGRRSSEIRTLRWGDLRQEGGRWWYEWHGKGGKSRRDELPLPVYQAITTYLQAAGRLDGMEEESVIFTALSRVAERLPSVVERGLQDGNGSGSALSSSFVNRVVKKCARRAGLRWKEIHTHTLRHTAAMLRRELGGDLQELQEFLNHSSLAITQIYVQHTEKRTDTMWAQVEALIGVE